ncbi:hypothetical protein EF847_11775 [Actinobacteria bacterium YIM 96077]|uniref:Clp R domain-containing protein n=1 Tax=Phytoactinopolyspora halophila TaxID=1981511 RepID=A0A329R0H6_9ACTN|nr:hypothetical protein EF847_11775 [Actinobacteria bacterium YIM 96077]RAW17489.1 hypothetical protein DPM12_05645 [Phytoactinopolyspora halophila]
MRVVPCAVNVPEKALLAPKHVDSARTAGVWQEGRHRREGGHGMVRRRVVGTPRYRATLEAAESVSREMGHGHVGVEHLFLAMIQDPRSIAGAFGDDRSRPYRNENSRVDGVGRIWRIKRCG